MFKVLISMSPKWKAIYRLSDKAVIPFDPANTDYANFKRDIEDGAELQDADGNVMSQADAQEFIRSLP